MTEDNGTMPAHFWKKKGYNVRIKYLAKYAFKDKCIYSGIQIAMRIFSKKCYLTMKYEQPKDE